MWVCAGRGQQKGHKLVVDKTSVLFPVGDNVERSSAAAEV